MSIHRSGKELPISNTSSRRWWEKSRHLRSVFGFLQQRCTICHVRTLRLNGIWFGDGVMIRSAIGGWAIGLMLTLPVAAQQSADSGQFDLLVAGIKAATISFSGQQTGPDYAVTGQIKSSGLMSLIKRLRYDGVATGSIKNGSYRPSSYRDSADTGKRQSDAVLEYHGGVPQVISFSPEPDPETDLVDPTTMAGAVDPLTAFFATMRVVEKGTECHWSTDLFDGRRASRLQLGKPQMGGDQVICPGVYTRIKGFTPKEMAQKPRFDFTLTYALTGTDQMQVVEVTAETIYGKVTLKRR
jgi:hypothetical protein